MSSLEDELDALAQLSLNELKHKWLNLSGSPAPKTISTQLLKLALAYKMQERVLGSLSRNAELRLKALSAAERLGIASQRPAANHAKLKPGTKFLREWQGKTHEVMALDDGSYVYGGRTHRSLTTIARLITGTHQSGPRFFGFASNTHGK